MHVQQVGASSRRHLAALARPAALGLRGGGGGGGQRHEAGRRHLRLFGVVVEHHVEGAAVHVGHHAAHVLRGRHRHQHRRAHRQVRVFQRRIQPRLVVPGRGRVVSQLEQSVALLLELERAEVGQRLPFKGLQRLQARHRHPFLLRASGVEQHVAAGRAVVMDKAHGGTLAAAPVRGHDAHPSADRDERRFHGDEVGGSSITEPRRRSASKQQSRYSSAKLHECPCLDPPGDPPSAGLRRPLSTTNRARIYLSREPCLLFRRLFFRRPLHG